MSRKRIPALPLPVKNLLVLYGLEAELQHYGTYMFDIYNKRPDSRGVLRWRCATVRSDASVEQWVAILSSARRQTL